MKLKYVSFSILLLALSCSLEPTMNWLDFDYHIDFSKVDGGNQIMKINNWCQLSNNIQYSEHSKLFQLPKETLDLRSGCCRDIPALIIALSYRETGIKGNLILVYNANRTSSHYIAQLNEKIYDGYNSIFENLYIYLKINPKKFEYVEKIIYFDFIQTSLYYE